jgi:hypothetical protein
MYLKKTQNPSIELSRRISRGKSRFRPILILIFIILLTAKKFQSTMRTEKTRMFIVARNSDSDDKNIIVEIHEALIKNIYLAKMNLMRLYKFIRYSE